MSTIDSIPTYDLRRDTLEKHLKNKVFPGQDVSVEVSSAPQKQHVACIRMRLTENKIACHERLLSYDSQETDLGKQIIIRTQNIDLLTLNFMSIYRLRRDLSTNTYEFDPTRSDRTVSSQICRSHPHWEIVPRHHGLLS